MYKFGKVKLICKTCNKEFFVNDYEVRRGRIYCSRDCRKLTQKSKDKIGRANSAEKNGMWKGGKAGLDAIHMWVSKRFKKKKLCQICKKNKPYDLANISQKYKRDLDDWMWLCRKCHMESDGRMGNLRNNKYEKK